MKIIQDNIFNNFHITKLDSITLIRIPGSDDELENEKQIDDELV